MVFSARAPYHPKQLHGSPERVQYNQNSFHTRQPSSSNGAQSQTSSSNNKTGVQVQFSVVRLQSEVLELVKGLSLDFDQLSPQEVRQQLRQLITAETDARTRREAYLAEILHHRVAEIEGRYTEQFEKLRTTFELEMIKFEKALKDRAQGVIKSLQMKQLDRLINLVGRIRQIHNKHAGANDGEPCKQTQAELGYLLALIDSMMSEQSNEDSLSHALIEQFNFASQEELQRIQGSTPFNPNLRDQVLALQQNSSNGVVANKYNKAVATTNPSGLQSGSGVRFGAATSCGNVTSGEGLPMPMSASNILSPSATPSQEFPNPAENTLSNPQIQNMHRSQTTANQFVKPGAIGRPRFVYELPKDFPFNEACIEKSLSNDLASSAFRNGSHGNGSNSQQTTSNHDVNPEDVLRTFTNSLHSGGTLGAIHSSLTYYKEALASKEWSNLSPSNAYQNFMWKKNLVGEIQKLAKEISRIPTEEAKILADLSKSHLSNDNSRVKGLLSGYEIGKSQMPTQLPPGMSNAEAISKGLGFIGNNESSILMDLNRASIVAARKEAEELKQQTKRIVDDSATRLEPVVSSYTDAPLNSKMMQPQFQLLHSARKQDESGYRGGKITTTDSTEVYGQHNFIQYMQQPYSSIGDSQGLFPDRQNSSSQNMRIMYEYARNANDSVMHDSCVMYEEVGRSSAKQDSKKSLQPIYPHLNYHASNERSQLSDSIDIVNVVNEESNIKPSQSQGNTPAPRSRLPLTSLQQNKSHRRHNSFIVGQQTIQNIDPNKAEPQEKSSKLAPVDFESLRTRANAERGCIENDRGELSPKQLRNESLSLQRSSIAAKRKVQQPGFFSNDAVERFTDIELEQIEKAQNFQQTASFAPQNRTPWWLEDAHEVAQNKTLFQQTAGPNMAARNILVSKLKQSGRRRGTQSMRSQNPNFGQNNAGRADQEPVCGYESRFGDQNLSNTALDNKGRAIKKQEQTSGNLYDELSRVAEYQSSRSVLEGYSSRARNQQQTNLNRTMQVKKKQHSNVQKDEGKEEEAERQAVHQNRDMVSKSVLTNRDRASPIISASGVTTNGSRVAKMNIKKTQIKLVGGVATKRSSIQVGSSSGQQSKSVSREGRLKVKLVTRGVPNPSMTPSLDHATTQLEEDVSRLSSCNNNRAFSVVSENKDPQERPFVNQSPKESRNLKNLETAIGPTASSQFQTDGQRQREFSPQHERLVGLQQHNQVGAFANKIPFKASKQERREDAGSVSNHRIRNNFFSENTEEPLADQVLEPSAQQRDPVNVSQSSAPLQPQNQALKIRRNRKQAKRSTPTIEEADDHQYPLAASIDRDEAEEQFNEIAKNLRQKSQQQGKDIFIRRGSNYPQGNPQQQSVNQSTNTSLNKGSSIAAGDAKSRQPFVRTFKSHKSRQVEDLDRPFGTQRDSFHKSALVGEGEDRQSRGTSHEGDGSKVAGGYRRPVQSITAQNAVTVRVQSHSQPPLGAYANHKSKRIEEPQIIPPPTEAFFHEEQLDENYSTPGQISGGGSINVNSKRPVVKMTAINFIGQNSNASQEPAKQKAPSFASVQNSVGQSGSQFSFHHHPDQQPPEVHYSIGAQKPSIAAQLETSPYMTQQKTVQNAAQMAATKRVIHLKRPSTNLQQSHSNQPSLIGKTAFAQRASSRVEQIDRQNDLQFQSQGNNGEASGSSTVSGLQRPSAQIRISKKTTTATQR